MGLFDRMTFEEAYEVVTSLNPGKSELNKAEKTIGKMSTADKRVEPAVVLLCLHGKSRGTADAAFDVFRRVVTKRGFCEELRQVVNTEVFFQKFYDAYMGGSLKSAYMTALCFEKGWGTWRNHEKAVEIAGVLRERTDDADAQKVCEVVFGKENTKNPEEIYEQSEQLYKDGKLEESAALCEKAAELGHVQAMNATGYNYMYGDGVEPDVEKAAKWLRKAMAAGHAKAPINLARMGLYFGYEMDPEEIFTLLHTGVQKGISYAFAPLAECYYRGDGCPENQKLAVYWAQKAMEEKDSLGYALMGIFYNEGFYVPKVKSMAKHILLELKELDGTDIFGDLTEPIPEELEPAAPVLPVFDDAQPDFFTEECPYSQYIRGLQYLNGTDGEKDIPVDAAKGEELLTKAANQGLACAMQSLGIKYIDPHHREQVRYDEDGTVAGFAGNNELGLSLLRKAADLGDYEAIDCMIMLETEDIGITSEESRYYEELQEKLYQQSGAVSDEETNDTDVTEDAIEEVYEQDVDTADDGFETMTDYYNACIDEDSVLFNDGFGHLHSAVTHITPFFQAVIANLEDRDPATAQEFLAEIVQVDLLALNEATANEGIFSREELQLYDLCECALKCAYNECIANPNELTETAMLHFAYYLYNEYSTLNERSPSNFFMYYLDYYIQTYGIEKNIMWDIGALYFARIYVNDQQYSAIPEGEVYYELEEIYGEFLDSLFEDENIDIFANVQGRLYDSEIGYINAEVVEEELSDEQANEVIQTFETKNGNTYRGYVDSEGRCHGWGEMQYADGDVYVGHWRNGFRHGFGMELWSDGTLRVGEFVNGELNGIGFERAGSASVNNANGYYRLIEATYFKNDEKAPNPAFCYEYMGREHGFGAYSDVYRYYGQLDEYGDADGWCCLWNPKREPQYYSEGMYAYGDIDFGMRLWLYKDGRTTWCYGNFAYSKEENTYYMFADIRGYYGEVAIDKGKPCLYYYDTGVFANNSLHGDGTRYYPNGVIINGRFEEGYLREIYSVTKPNGEKGSPEDYEEYIGYSEYEYYMF